MHYTQKIGITTAPEFLVLETGILAQVRLLILRKGVFRTKISIIAPEFIVSWGISGWVSCGSYLFIRMMIYTWY